MDATQRIGHQHRIRFTHVDGALVPGDKVIRVWLERRFTGDDRKRRPAIHGGQPKLQCAEPEDKWGNSHPQGMGNIIR